MNLRRVILVKIRIAEETDAGGIAFVKVKTWQTAYANIFPKDILANLSIQENKEIWMRIIREGKQDINTEIYVAETTFGKIVGFVAGGIIDQTFPYDCQITAIYVLKEYQGKGIGSKLVDIIVKKFLELGFKTMKIEVLEENPACLFYEKLGGVKEKIIQWERWGESYPLAIYVWKDINPILSITKSEGDQHGFDT